MNTSMNSYRRRNDPQINYKITETCKVPAVSISGIACVIIYEVTQGDKLVQTERKLLLCKQIVIKIMG